MVRLLTLALDLSYPVASMYNMQTTNAAFSRSLDREVARANRAFLDSPAQQEQAEMDARAYLDLAALTPEQRAAKSRQGMEAFVRTIGAAKPAPGSFERKLMLSLIRSYNSGR